jgi:proteasome accessory factor B
MHYPSSDSADASAICVRQVDPYGLYFRQGVWYLVGYCHLRRARRTFHLGRLAQIELCSRPKAFAFPADFNIEKAARMRAWQYPKAAPVRVDVRLAERIVPAVTEVFGADVVVHRDAAGPYVHIDVAHPEAFLAAIMPLGDAAEVVSPPHIRALVAQTYATLAARYAALKAAS